MTAVVSDARASVVELVGVREDEVLPQDIVVLSSHALKSTVGQVGAGGYTFTKDSQKPGKSIHCSSIRGFKGLDGATIDQQLYVGFSRARNHCVWWRRDRRHVSVSNARVCRREDRVGADPSAVSDRAARGRPMEG